MSNINIVLEAGEWEETLSDVQSIAENALEFVEGELSLVLADDAFIQDLNHQFRGHNKPTNVLSFPSDDDDAYLGDVIVALETLQREAREQNKALSHHFTHMVIHGALHLQGLDHEEEAEAKIMEAKEIQLLEALAIANPYETH